MSLQVHAIANIFPPMSEAEFQALKADIDQYGQREPVWLYEGKVIDGRHRVRACDELGRQPRTEVYDGFDAVAFVVSLNLHRRHLSESQRGIAFAKAAQLYEKGGDRRSENFKASNEALKTTQAAMKVSDSTADRSRKVVGAGADELISAVESGKVSVSAAATIAQAPKEQQREIVAKGEREILQAAKEIRAERSEVRRAENARLKASAPALPSGKHECIVIDPPWEMQKIERDVRPNQVAFEYPTMSEAELAAFDVPAIAADDCHLFCWTTHKHLPQALRLVEQWGFRYVCTLVWHKPGGFQPIGLPQYNCEFALYARRGSPEFIDTKAFPVCFNAPRREHSRKPDEFYDVIRRVTAGPRIDVFSRESREGFSTFGNEAEKFDEVA